MAEIERAPDASKEGEPVRPPDASHDPSEDRATPIADGVWAVTRPFRVIGVWLGTRMTVVRLPTGGLLLHSPVAIDDRARAQVDALGVVEHIVAPSKVHHLFVPGWVAAYPEAKLWGAPGLKDKRADLAFSGELNDEPAPEWSGVLEQRLVRGAPYMNEMLFLHRPSRSLMVTDVVFNLREVSQWWSRTYLKVMGAYAGFGQSKMVKLCVRERKAVRESIDRVLEWDFDRIVVTHGDVLETGGPEALREAFAWL